ncbi:MAG TPA: hypothetical protein ENG14_00970 [Thermodesulforhabdus norvegica]|uniref:Uncharacterized protein n=1 Tax=Thermodesulforhabdus norvegica TaxID=39841 RepID=A0A7C1AVA7_9BACT|nr:hypothetical protein [Deltaproteobacteria bacterium]MBW2067331.1 hypothetical protein [Deltaproteobacteria bacterium]HDL89458.1 hypothetical protein [Thermodesulforhabdus norvegica]
MKWRKFGQSTLMATLISFCLWSIGWAGNKQLMSEKMAKQDLKRNLVEMVVGYKVRSEGQFGLTENPNYRIQTKAGALIKGINVEKMIYDKEKDIAFCTGYIDLGDVINVVGERMSFKNVRVRGYGFGTMTPSSKPPLMALRAALLNAYDELAAKIVGERIMSVSEAENFILTNDINRSKVLAAVYGAYIPNIDLDHPNRGWGWDEDGNAFVRLRLDVRKVRDILGQNIRYEGPNIVEVIGRGAQKDELSGPQEGAPGGSRLHGTEYRSLPVPTGSTAERELKAVPAPPGGPTPPQAQQ